MQTHELQRSGGNRELSFGGYAGGGGFYAPTASSDERIEKRAVLTREVDGAYMRRLQRLGKRVHGLSARQVAEQFRVTRATFKAWESGKKKIKADHAERARNL